MVNCPYFCSMVPLIFQNFGVSQKSQKFIVYVSSLPLYLQVLKTLTYKIYASYLKFQRYNTKIFMIGPKTKEKMLKLRFEQSPGRHFITYMFYAPRFHRYLVVKYGQQGSREVGSVKAPDFTIILFSLILLFYYFIYSIYLFHFILFFR